MIWALLLVPAVAGLTALAIRPNRPRRGMLLLAALVHTVLVGVCWSRRPTPIVNGWMAIDPAGLLFLSITSVLFALVAVYVAGYLGRRIQPCDVSRNKEDLPFVNFPEAVFTGCLLFFLATMTLVTVSQHLGLMWVGVEATTLASAPLIYFHRHHRSLEATWKYLLICSVGIALALLGNFFVAVAARGAGGSTIQLTIEQLTTHAGGLDPLWLKAAFLFFLVGYGTKMGIAPLHAWLPDAHSEAPSGVSALLSGALLNCAFLAILRIHSLLASASFAAFSSELLVVFGLISMAVAAVFILGQTDYKRMLAYSSVEHMGILCLGIGIGGVATFGALLHTVNHSLTKAMLFLAAGNILAFYHTKSISGVQGVLRNLPITGVLWLTGFLAIVGSPPFGPFLSELAILKGVIDAGRTAVAVVYLAALAIVFVGMATIFLRMACGLPQETPLAPANPSSVGNDIHLPAPREPLWSTAPVMALGLAMIVLGVYVPPPLVELLRQIVASLGVR